MMNQHFYFLPPPIPVSGIWWICLQIVVVSSKDSCLLKSSFKASCNEEFHKSIYKTAEKLQTYHIYSYDLSFCLFSTSSALGEKKNLEKFCIVFSFRKWEFQLMKCDFMQIQSHVACKFSLVFYLNQKSRIAISFLFSPFYQLLLKQD